MKVAGPVVIACGADSSYLLPLAVMLRSVVDNVARDRHVDVYILHSSVTAAERDRVTSGLPAARLSVRWVSVDESALAGVPLWGRMSVATYFKLLIADCLPTKIERAIWLDCDLLVNCDITELWDIDLHDLPVAAAQDRLVPLASSRGGIRYRARLGISDDAKYFNAGVMLIDLARWRAARVAERTLDYLRAHWKSVAFWDQEGLNVALAGRWVQLSPRWNRNVSIPGDRAHGNLDGCILHFAGRLKPWLYKIRDPEFSLYLNYLDRTAWKGSRPAGGVAAAMVSLYERSGIRSLLHPLENLLADFARKSFRETMLNTASQGQ
jgi:lipopolysaccharide biosynthesis glycosyltransferase